MERHSPDQELTYVTSCTDSVSAESSTAGLSAEAIFYGYELVVSKDTLGGLITI